MQKSTECHWTHMIKELYNVIVIVNDEVWFENNGNVPLPFMISYRNLEL